MSMKSLQVWVTTKCALDGCHISLMSNMKTSRLEVCQQLLAIYQSEGIDFLHSTV